jgi:hypothetical protein
MTGIMFVISLVSITYDPNVEEDEEDKKLASQNKSGATRGNMYFEFIDCSVWKSPKYVIGTILIFLTFLGLYVPMIHLVSKKSWVI